MLTSLLLSSAGFDQHPNLQQTEHARLPRGKVVLQRIRGMQGQGYYLYIPRTCGANSPLMISVHGVSRNARQHAALLAPLAERFGVVLVAPLFTQQLFPDYQRLGRLGRGPRADLALDQIIGDVLYKTACDFKRLYLFGYSGGGQFAHRYAMAHPERVGGVVVGAAGWYTFPDASIRFPRGNAASAELNSLHFDAERYLRVPMSVVVGSEDNKRDAELNKSARIDKQQGLNRLQRGENWIMAMRRQAEVRGLATPYSIETMPGIRHSFKDGMQSGQLGERIFRLLFDHKTTAAETYSLRKDHCAIAADPLALYTDIKPELQYGNQAAGKQPW